MFAEVAVSAVRGELLLQQEKTGFEIADKCIGFPFMGDFGLPLFFFYLFSITEVYWAFTFHFTVLCPFPLLLMDLEG